MHQKTTALLIALALIAGACVTQPAVRGSLHRWWAGLGPVLPHDTFPGDCKLCHVGARWNTLKEDFEFDHAIKTGVPLRGAHQEAMCLRCHNDRGPVSVFDAKGCAGCHEDSHNGRLGKQCATCHTERTWEPILQRQRHTHSRFPLSGAHATVACHKCHVGARVGNFSPTSPECLNCHTDDLNNTSNPPHIPLGWVDNCDRCHMATRWEQATSR
jgi:hypothetical protein